MRLVGKCPCLEDVGDLQARGVCICACAETLKPNRDKKAEIKADSVGSCYLTWKFGAHRKVFCSLSLDYSQVLCAACNLFLELKDPRLGRTCWAADRQAILVTLSIPAFRQ